MEAAELEDEVEMEDGEQSLTLREALVEACQKVDTLAQELGDEKAYRDELIAQAARSGVKYATIAEVTGLKNHQVAKAVGGRAREDALDQPAS
jgi:hypothetical protein